MRAHLRKTAIAGLGIAGLAAASGLAGQAEAAPLTNSSARHQAASSKAAGLTMVPVARAGGPDAATEYRATLAPGGHKLCLSTSSGNIVVNTCSSTSNYQRWEIGLVDGFSVWDNVGHPGDVLTTSGSTSGSAMVLKAIHDGDRTQSFDFVSEQQTIYWTPNSKLVLEAKNDTSGSRVYLITKSGVGDQQFDVTVAN